jgi:hypothetical protein
LNPDANMNNLYPLPADDSIFHFTYPAAAFDHDEGKAIEGGFEYEGVPFRNSKANSSLVIFLPEDCFL